MSVHRRINPVVRAPSRWRMEKQKPWGPKRYGGTSSSEQLMAGQGRVTKFASRCLGVPGVVRCQVPRCVLQW